MCKAHGGTYEGNLRVELAHPYKNGKAWVSVDACIQPLVQALNDGGIQTLNSCCGHGYRPGWIALEDGRQIMIMPSLEAMKEIDHLWPDILGNKMSLNETGEI